jgi:hypothetical protein
VLDRECAKKGKGEDRLPNGAHTFAKKISLGVDHALQFWKSMDKRGKIRHWRPIMVGFLLLGFEANLFTFIA